MSDDARKGTKGPLIASIRAQDLELRMRYSFGAECVRMHPEDATTLDASTVCGMEIYVDAETAPGEPEIGSPEEASRRCGPA